MLSQTIGFPSTILQIWKFSTSASDLIWGQINDYRESSTGYNWNDRGFIEEYFNKDAPNSTDYWADQVT